MLLSNVLGVAGLTGLVLAVFMLTGSPWWTLLLASLLLLSVAYAIYTHTPPAEPAPNTPPAAAAPEPRRGGV
ncbi:MULTISPECIES: hypothetical protein [unclassified Crossiella]|uniref:hypothetical protein n=1 Tax=unclassified Crossiella TaxID=2620835 RepID=UPI001FFFC3D9|nr:MULTISPECIES: hypothetical protein [unclassified Crossiella]MCK2242154.1 hypothetical protein [Crossiella sp. S99.2]MCK2256057.1 hypothetical protein [Crossiella sp. S99.1]